MDEAPPAPLPAAILTFGPFRLDLTQQQLWRDNEPVQLGARALAILAALLERPGELMPKAELFARAWPGVSVDEANLRVQIAGLRKTLGSAGGDIRAEAGLGYRLIGPTSAADADPRAPLSQKFALPGVVDDPIGRDAEIAAIRQQVSRHRLVSLVGPGGIGKTTVALAVARSDGPAFPDGVCFVDFGLLSDPDQAAAAVAAAFERTVSAQDPLDEVLIYLRRRELLLILDCCEHVAEAVARIADRVLAAASRVRVLVTSREVLRVAGEVVEHLEALETPPDAPVNAAAEILGFPSVRLFARGAQQSLPDFDVIDANAAAVAEICRRLDGIPFALELAAAMVGMVGIHGVRQGLDERFSVLTLGRRTALPRHRTLAATMAWSFDLLSAEEQAVLRRLATFAGPFALDAAIAVGQGDAITEAEARHAVLELANKSLLSVDLKTDPPTYRLLETTRAYVQQVPAPAGERKAAGQRHGRFFLDLLEAKDWEAYDPAAESGTIRGYMAEVRTALEAAYGDEGDAELPIRLAVAAERPWLELSMISESARYLSQAYEHLDRLQLPDPSLRARLLVALAYANVYTASPDLTELGLYELALEQAEIADDALLKMRALFMLIYHYLAINHPQRCLDYIARFHRAAEDMGDPHAVMLSENFLGFVDVAMSKVTECIRRLEGFVQRYENPPRYHIVYFAHSHRVSSLASGAPLLWQLGQFDAAMVMSGQALAEGQRLQHGPSQFYVYAQGGIWLQLKARNIETARAYLRDLKEITRAYKPWEPLAQAYEGMLALETGDLETAERYLYEGLHSPIMVKTGGLRSSLLFELAETRLRRGDLRGAEGANEEAWAGRSHNGDARLTTAYLRIKAEIAAAQGGPGREQEADRLFRDAMELARSKSLFFYELEAALGLARHELQQGRRAEAGSLLGALLARVPESHNCPTLGDAESLLAEVSRGAV